MQTEEEVDQTIVIRMGYFLPMIFMAMAVFFFLVGVSLFFPATPNYDPKIGALVSGISLLFGAGVFWFLRNRPVQVILTPSDLQLPGFEMGPIPWEDIVESGIVEVRVNGVSYYLGIVLTEEASQKFKQPRLLKVVGKAVGLASGRKYDLLLNCDLLEWSADALAAAINERVSTLNSPTEN